MKYRVRKEVVVRGDNTSNSTYYAEYSRFGLFWWSCYNGWYHEFSLPKEYDEYDDALHAINRYKNNRVVWKYSLTYKVY